MSEPIVNRDDLLSRPRMQSLVPAGIVEIRAGKKAQRDMDLSLEILMDSQNVRYNIREVARSAVAAGWAIKTVAQGLGYSTVTIANWISDAPSGSPAFDYAPPTVAVPKMVKRIETIPASRIGELTRLNGIIRTINGMTPLNDPRRALSQVYGDLLVKTMDEYDVGCRTISIAMGLSGRNVQLWLGRHGYVHRAPSQPGYKNTTSYAARQLSSKSGTE